jgi:hypothetical protein
MKMEYIKNREGRIIGIPNPPNIKNLHDAGLEFLGAAAVNAENPRKRLSKKTVQNWDASESAADAVPAGGDDTLIAACDNFVPFISVVLLLVWFQLLPALLPNGV